ncbi:hypothetical protein [Nesterenkonia pannonica]|uniref:hypothetical protein n=1 Tax=Nesterenkonia pannonica TaxID=1548602 RepID=UPI0021642320|nr:hypothetical protein [Nesterenkonia pannonica]
MPSTAALLLIHVVMVIILPSAAVPVVIPGAHSGSHQKGVSDARLRAEALRP